MATSSSSFSPRARAGEARFRALARTSRAVRVQGICGLALVVCGVSAYLDGFYAEYQVQQHVHELNGVICVEAGGDPTADHLTLLRYLRGYRIVGVSFAHQASIGDEDLLPLRNLPRLKTALLAGTSVSGKSLELLGRIDTLEQLDVSATDVNDSSIEFLAPLENLEYLSLNRTGVTDGGLRYLCANEQLKCLSIVGIPATDRGVNQLRNALPELSVVRGPDLSRLSLVTAILHHDWDRRIKPFGRSCGSEAGSRRMKFAHPC